MIVPPPAELPFSVDDSDDTAGSELGYTSAAWKIIAVKMEIEARIIRAMEYFFINVSGPGGGWPPPGPRDVSLPANCYRFRGALVFEVPDPDGHSVILSFAQVFSGKQITECAIRGQINGD